MSQLEMSEPLRRRSVGQIAAKLAGATGVFRSFGIDFCCHGNVPLDEAAQAGGVDVEAVEKALLVLDVTGELPTLPEDTGELIDHILTRYHEVHRRQVPELIMLSRKVEQVHAGRQSVPSGLADMLQHALGELEVHMKKEELMLFPVMRRQGSGPLDGPIANMHDDHVEHGEFLDRLTEITDNFTPPEGACGSWRALYSGAAQLKNDLIEHIHIENNILFPRFESGTAARPMQEVVTRTAFGSSAPGHAG